jgi:hypothetical protein
MTEVSAPIKPTQTCELCHEKSRNYKPYCLGCESDICDECDASGSKEKTLELVTCCRNILCYECRSELIMCSACKKMGCPICLDRSCGGCDKRLCDSCAKVCDRCGEFTCPREMSNTNTDWCAVCVKNDKRDRQREKNREAKRKFLEEHPTSDFGSDDSQ